MDILELNNNFTISEGVNGPVIGAAIGVEIVLAAIANFYILLYTLCHRKILRQPSTIFLTSLTVANLILVLIFMPFSLISAAAGEWIFGQTPNQRYGVCRFVGLTLAYPIALTGLHLTIISIDRFLFIVKPMIYKSYIKPMTATIIVIVLWIVSALLVAPPFFGFGRYGYSKSVGTCVPIWIGEVGFVIYSTVIGIFLLSIVTVTSVWTFCFTRHFIKKQKKNQNRTPEVEHVYNEKIRNLVSIFGTLLLVYIICFSPYIVVSVVGFGVGFQNIPSLIYAAVFIFVLFITSANPLVQVYFRKDMNMFLFNICKKTTDKQLEENNSNRTSNDVI